MPRVSEPASRVSAAATHEVDFRYSDSTYTFTYIGGPRSHVADRVLVLQPGVRSVTLRWETRVQDIGPPETSRLHVISNGENSLRDLHLNAKTQFDSTTSKLQCWTPYAKQLARQEHNPTR